MKRENINKIAKPYYEDADSVIHRWGHVHRVAKGAPLFVEALGGTEDEKDLSYMAGVLHDIVRPQTEERDHAEASSEKAVKVLRKKTELPEKDIESIRKAIVDHRKPADWESPLHQSVYLADKILEHMGAYLDFRASVWAGELLNTDYRGKEPVEAVLDYYEQASKKFLKLEFPDILKEVVDYQRGWNKEYMEALKEEEDWAIDMAERLTEAGKEGRDFEKTLKNFRVRYEEQGDWKDEMLRYLEFDKSGKPFALIPSEKN